MSSPLPLAGKVAVITGASGGIGAGCALELARVGCAVFLGARREAKLEEVKAQVESEVPGARVGFRVADVTSRDSVKELVAAAESELGPVDVLVNNAGVMYFTLMKNAEQDDWDRVRGRSRAHAALPRSSHPLPRPLRPRR